MWLPNFLVAPLSAAAFAAAFAASAKRTAWIWTQLSNHHVQTLNFCTSVSRSWSRSGEGLADMCNMRNGSLCCISYHSGMNWHISKFFYCSSIKSWLWTKPGISFNSVRLWAYRHSGSSQEPALGAHTEPNEPAYGALKRQGCVASGLCWSTSCLGCLIVDPASTPTLKTKTKIMCCWKAADDRLDSSADANLQCKQEAKLRASQVWKLLEFFFLMSKFARGLHIKGADKPNKQHSISSAKTYHNISGYIRTYQISNIWATSDIATCQSITRDIKASYQDISRYIKAHSKRIKTYQDVLIKTQQS